MEKPICISCVPKCGTGYLQQLLYGSGISIKPQNEKNLQPGETLIKHISYNHFPNDLVEKSKFIVLVRDPRDQIVSLFHHWKNKHNHDSLKANFDFYLENSQRQWEVNCVKWVESGDVEFLRYEDLIKSPTIYLGHVGIISDHEGATKIRKRAHEIRVNREQLRGKLHFRKGVSGEYKHEFDKEMLSKYYEVMGKLHKDILNYEV